MAATVQDCLDRIEKVQNSIKVNEGLPGALLEKISEGNGFLTTLPPELDDRLKYLNNNKQLRIDYQGLKGKFYDWTKNAEKKIQKGSSGVDFDSVQKDLDNHKVIYIIFFSFFILREIYFRKKKGNA